MKLKKFFIEKQNCFEKILWKINHETISNQSSLLNEAVINIRLDLKIIAVSQMLD